MKPIVHNSGGGRLSILPAAILAVAWLVTPAPLSAQDECEIPLFVQQYVSDANVMILADNSGSMNEVILHPDYDRHTSYDGVFNPDKVYYINSPWSYSPRSFSSSWPSSPTAWLINSDGGQKGRYWGNYLNWIYFHATDLQRATLPMITRIQVLKLVLKDIVSRSERIRFGITVMQYKGPGSVIGPCGMSADALTAVIDGIVANVWTPLGESMETLVDYFSREGAGAPIQSWCQKNFIICMTDGFPTMDRDVSHYLWDQDGDGNDPGSCASIGAPYPESNECSDHMDDVAYYLYNNDLQPNMPGDQNVMTYTIGYSINAELLRDTAVNGNGQYFQADNAAELIYAFQLAMQDIIMRISSGSAVAVVSTERGDDDRMYRGKFMPGTWEGFLECFQLPYDADDDPVWEAGHILESRSAHSREIFTGLGNVVYPFDGSHASELVEAMGLDEDTEMVMAAEIIEWTRGHEVYGYRDRANWKLGDIVSSTPVIVGPPNQFSTDPDYQDFHNYYADRRKLIYVGANDGMLHAFDSEYGEESWAFVPEFSLPKLPAIADSFYCHTFTCDQTVTVKDVKLGGVWRTVLVAGGRQGGAGYFALDITEPISPYLLWQNSLPDGYANASEVEIVQIGDIPVALMGSGLNDGDGKAYIYALDLQSGSIIGEKKLSDISTRNKTTRPRGVDKDLDGITDIVYCGDMDGNLWRFEVEDNPDPGSWHKTRLFKGDQPITATPTLAFGYNEDVLIYFGTGAYLVPDDILETDQQSFYCIKDKHEDNSLERADLVDQTSTIHDMGTADGWYVDLWHDTGERVTEQALVVAGVVFFTSYAPLSDVCQAGGHSWLYSMSYDDGSAVEDEDGNELPRDEDLGDGIASRPVADIVNETAVIQSSDATISVVDIAPAIFHLNVVSWQENYDFVVEPPEGNP